MPAYPIVEYVNLPQPVDTWLWDGIVPAGGAALLFAKQKIGKSFLALSLAEAVADPEVEQFMGQHIGVHGNVLYIQLDTPRGLWVKNYIKNVHSSRSRENIYIVDREMDDIPMPFDIRTRGCQNWLQEQVDMVKPVLTIADTFRRMHRCDENDNTEMSIIYDTMVNLTRPGALLIAAHERKSQHEGQEPTMRGASSVAGAVDCLIHMTKKRLKFEARSDIEEEMRIFQRDDGTFTTFDAATEVDEYLVELEQKFTKAGDIDKAVADRFGVSARTARRWRQKEL